jgi:hypothetical protein
MALATAAILAGTLAVGTYAALEAKKAMDIKPPKPVAPPSMAAIDAESEGIRRTAMAKQGRTEQLQRLYATRGTRAEDATLGGYRQTLA